MSYPSGGRVVCARCGLSLMDGNGPTDWQECEWCRQEEERKRVLAIECDPFYGFREEEDERG